MSESWTHHRATIGALRRNGRSADDLDVLNAQRDLRVARLADHIQRVVDAAPPLSAEQVQRLRALLPPVDAAPSGGASE